MRDTLLQFVPLIDSVELPKRRGGAKVFVRELNGEEVIAFVKQRETDAGDAIYELIKIATVDEDGKRIFLDTDTTAMLRAKLPYDVASAITDKILELTGLTEEAQKKRKPAAAR